MSTFLSTKKIFIGFFKYTVCISWIFWYKCKIFFYWVEGGGWLKLSRTWSCTSVCTWSCTTCSVRIHKAPRYNHCLSKKGKKKKIVEILSLYNFFRIFLCIAFDGYRNSIKYIFSAVYSALNYMALPNRKYSKL